MCFEYRMLFDNKGHMLLHDEIACILFYLLILRKIIIISILRIQSYVLNRDR